TGRTIQQRIRDIAAEREQRAAAEEAIADRRRRVEVASTFLPPVITPPEPPDPTAERTARLQGIRGRLGPEIDSAAAEFARLEAATVQVKNQIDQLPAGVRTRFIPAIRDAEDELLRLAATDASPEELERATQRVVQLRQEVGRAERAFNAFGGSFRDFADASDIQRAAGRLAALRQQLARATGDTTQAEAAADRYAATLQQAANTQGGFRRLAAEINRVEQSAVNATAAVSGISVRRLNENLNRAGDVGRGAFGNAGLAIQQAAFAVDDFFSVTGGIEQRIRAVGNNISQLGFVIGGTYGLIAGISASVGAQAIAFLIKWANSGRTAEIQTQALNDALARQKSLVEELAQSFASLGDSIARSAFSRSGGEARSFRRELDEIIKKQRELREERSFSLDEGVLRARADVRVSENALSAASTRDAAVTAQRDLAEARRRLAAEEARVRNTPAQTPQQIRDQVAREFSAASARQVNAAIARTAGTGDVGLEQAVIEARRLASQVEDAANARLRGIEDPAAQARILREEQQGAALRGDRRLVAQLEQIIGLLEDPVRRAADRFAVETIEVAQRAAIEIGKSQERISKAIESGEPSAVALQERLDSLTESIDRAQAEIANAQRDFAASAQSPADIAAREERIRLARESIQRDSQDRIVATNQSSVIASIADAFAPIRGLIDQTREASRQSAEEAQRRVLQAPDVTGRPLADLQRERDRAQADFSAAESRLRQLQSQLGFEQSAAARNPEVAGLTARIEAARQASEQATRAASASGRPEDIALALRLESQQAALEQQRAEALRRLTGATQAAIEAEQRLQTQRARQDEFRRAFLEQQQPAGEALRGLELLRGEGGRAFVQAQQGLADLQEAARGLAGTLPDNLVGNLLGSARRRLIEDINPAGISPARERQRQLEDVLGRAAEQASAIARTGDRAGAQQALLNTRDNLIRQQAPLLVGFSDEVANAL
ncbi:MAG: hypothetical protein EBR82_56570, partial [Caulobacteraceae bacterium]|nr:hypothetical protein [Caulobacteraceae bacterium]